MPLGGQCHGATACPLTQHLTEWLLKLSIFIPAGARFDVMGRRVLAGNPTLAPAVARVLAGCKTSSKEPPAPAADF